MQLFSTLAFTALVVVASGSALPKVSATIMTGPKPTGPAPLVIQPLPQPRGLAPEACPKQKDPPKWVPNQKPHKDWTIDAGKTITTLPDANNGWVAPEFANGLNALAFTKPVGPSPDANKGDCKIIDQVSWVNLTGSPIFSGAVHVVPKQRVVFTFTADHIVKKAGIMLLADISTRYVFVTDFPQAPGQAPGSGSAGTIEFEVKDEQDLVFSLELDSVESSGTIGLFTLGKV